MDLQTQRLIAAAGGAGGADSIFIDDIFAIDAFKGNGSNDGTAGNQKTIVNGLDLAGEGGMIWGKERTRSQEWKVFDSRQGIAESGSGPGLQLDSDMNGYSYVRTINSFNSDGYSLGSSAYGNPQYPISYYCFRKCPGFFTMKQYLGNDGTNNITHDLGCKPGFIAIKRIGGGTSHEDWNCVWNHNYSNYHSFNDDGATAGGSGIASEMTSTTIAISGSNPRYNANNVFYMMYIWAQGSDSDSQVFGHNDDEAVIKVDTYTGNGSANQITLGWEPSFLIVKNRQSGNWCLFDYVRGVITNKTSSSGGCTEVFYMNDTGSEDSLTSTGEWLEFNRTGFKFTNSASFVNASGNTYEYLAIRRPDGYVGKASAGTDLYAQDMMNSTGAGGPPDGPGAYAGFVVDAGTEKGGTSKTWMGLRSTGNRYSGMGDTSNGNAGSFVWDHSQGWGGYGNTTFSYMWKRGVAFDHIRYKGNNTDNRVLTHGLGRVPEMIWSFNHDDADNRLTYHFRQKATSSDSIGYFMKLNNDAGTVSVSSFLKSVPTSTQLVIGTADNINENNMWYSFLLFASFEGICKLGFYTGVGSGSTVSVDCGFQPRFVLIKRADSSGEWYHMNTHQGIDNYATWQTGAWTNLDLIDLTSTGFTVKGGGTTVNTSGGRYTFYAHA